MPALPGLTLVRTRRGARLVHAGHVVSEIAAGPGPTHGLFDVMAASVSALAPGPRLAVLGFGGGSVVAPLRALGWRHPIHGVDLSLEAALAYARIAGARLGEVSVTLRDAVAWIRGHRGRFHAVIEDLSLPVPGDLVMPPACFDALPGLIASRLAPRGIAIVNVFSPGPRGWQAHLRRLVPRGFHAAVIHPHEFDHRLLLLSRRLPDARAISLRLRAALRSIHSRQAARLAVRIGV